MAYKIIEKRQLNSANVLIKVHAPLVAMQAKAGQFVIVRPLKSSERIPLTISDYESESGVITLIFTPVGQTTYELASLKQGDFVHDVLGPLGNPTFVSGVKRAVVIGGGVGSAIALPVAKEFKKAGAYVSAILGFKNKELIILKDEFEKICDELIIATDDGSYGVSGNVCVPLKKILTDEKPDEVMAIGSLVMMKFVCNLTKEYGVKTIVSMNPIMIDGTGMCGGCRLMVGGKMKFACVDGPDFDGHAVDFDKVIKSNAKYAEEEKSAREKYCKLFGGVL